MKALARNAFLALSVEAELQELSCCGEMHHESFQCFIGNGFFLAGLQPFCSNLGVHILSFYQPSLSIIASTLTQWLL